MPDICKKHYKNLHTSRQICKIIYSQEFSHLYEELHRLYKTEALHEPDKKAFQDALYSIIAQKDCEQIIVNKALYF